MKTSLMEESQISRIKKDGNEGSWVQCRIWRGFQKKRKNFLGRVTNWVFKKRNGNWKENFYNKGKPKQEENK